MGGREPDSVQATQSMSYAATQFSMSASLSVHIHASPRIDFEGLSFTGHSVPNFQCQPAEKSKGRVY